MTIDLDQIYAQVGKLYLMVANLERQLGETYDRIATLEAELAQARAEEGEPRESCRSFRLVQHDDETED